MLLLALLFFVFVTQGLAYSTFTREPVIIPKMAADTFFCSAIYFAIATMDASLYTQSCTASGLLTISVPLGGQYATILGYVSDLCTLPTTISSFLVGGDSSSGCTFYNIVAKTTTAAPSLCLQTSVVGVCGYPPPVDPRNNNTITASSTSTSTLVTSITLILPSTSITTTSTTISTFITTAIIIASTSTGTLSQTTTATQFTGVTLTTTESSTSTQQETIIVSTGSTAINWDISVIETVDITTTGTTSTEIILDTVTSTVRSCRDCKRTPTFTTTSFTTVCTTTTTLVGLTETSVLTRQTLSTLQVCGGTGTSTACKPETTSCLPLGSVQTCTHNVDGYFVAYRPGISVEGGCVCRAAAVNGTFQYEVMEMQLDGVYGMIRNCLGAYGKVWAGGVQGQKAKTCLAARGDPLGGALEVDINCDSNYPILCLNQ